MRSVVTKATMNLLQTQYLRLENVAFTTAKTPSPAIAFFPDTRRDALCSQGKHSPRSDVWSFAVTLWEILMLCCQQPFAELTNEQVVENCNHWYLNDGLQRYLPRPASCPREIYDLMGECWKRQDEDRPRFSEIHLFLQRKNLGYIPANG